MRCPRLTYPGALHHCTARGIGGLNLFAGNREKNQLSWLLQEKIRLYRIRLIAFCIMGNHYHLVIQNRSGRMSEFFRVLNSQYAAWYQWRRNGRGYVFQDRFHSTLIQEGAYLEAAILYVLANPVRAGIVERCEDYEWSSACLYGRNGVDWLDSELVLEIFGNPKKLFRSVACFVGKDLDTCSTPFGTVLGSPDFVKMAIERFDRRKNPHPKMHRRRDDFHFLPVEQVFYEFERKQEIRVNQLDTRFLAGKQLRSELLVRLRDHAGLSFKQISELDIFAELQYKSLPQLYANARKRLGDL